MAASLRIAMLGAYDEETEANATEGLRAPAPVVTGEYMWSARLPAYVGDEV